MNENSPKLENVAMVTYEFGNVDFEAPFDLEGVRLCHPYPYQLDEYWSTNFPITVVLHNSYWFLW